MLAPAIHTLSRELLVPSFVVSVDLLDEEGLSKPYMLPHPQLFKNLRAKDSCSDLKDKAKMLFILTLTNNQFTISKELADFLDSCPALLKELDLDKSTIGFQVNESATCIPFEQLVSYALCMAYLTLYAEKDKASLSTLLFISKKYPIESEPHLKLLSYPFCAAFQPLSFYDCFESIDPRLYQKQLNERVDTKTGIVVILRKAIEHSGGDDHCRQAILPLVRFLSEQHMTIADISSIKECISMLREFQQDLRVPHLAMEALKRAAERAASAEAALPPAMDALRRLSVTVVPLPRDAATEPASNGLSPRT